ncbi:alpha/beta hydrolase [Gryllotalpicola reticulitermitis]|uniref:Alpha/beta hydrolase n=1 Tax=Gryllotalpicola reticulitermitis TaxID=1184153 RepID=A0ABV8Q110_9MICO
MFLQAWRAHPAFRRGARTLVALIIGGLVGFAWYHVSVQPGARIVRAVFEASPEVTPPAGFASTRAQVKVWPSVPITATGAPQSSLVLYTPAGTTGPRPIVLWVHGGGFISSSPSTVADFAIMLADAGYTVASLDYTLAPAATHPTPVRQANAALTFLEKHAGSYGGDPGRIVVGGDSAGAQIASELAAVQSNPAVAKADGIVPAVSSGLAAVVLYCGLYNLESVGSTGFPGLRTYLWAYTGKRNWLTAPGASAMSTVANVTSAYPPTFVTVGDKDPFDGQGHELATALHTHGVSVDTLFWDGSGDGLGHEYQFNYSTPEAREAFQRTLAFLHEQTGNR